MDIEQALKIMYECGKVESLVSNTVYSLEKLEDRFRLCAEGIPVDLSYLTKEEVQGEFREVYIVETQEQLNSLSDDDKTKLIDETFKVRENKRKFDKEIRG